MTNKAEIINYLQAIKPVLVQDGIERIGLFGSFANGKADGYSDIDIAVKFEGDFLQKRDAWAYFEVMEKLKNMIRTKFNTGCDVFDVNSNSYIAKSVEREASYV